MNPRIGRVALECFVDLGITVVYATIVGLLIVGVVASDDGPSSLLTSIFYASLLPAAVVVLIAIDVVLRVVADHRMFRRRRGSKAPADKQSGERALRLSRF